MSLVLANPAGSSNPEPGPQYAADNNESFTILDSHNHSPGSGVQITPAGLNINTDLTFQNNSATNVYGVQFSVPAASSNLTFLYTNAQSGGGITDLFFNDGAGNVIALTKAGEVNATLASLPGESYAGGTFTWKQGAGSTTPANFDIGSVTIRPNVAATTYGVVLNPPSGISSIYDIQLPFVPSTNTSFLQIDTSGNMSATIPITGGITGTNIANGTITNSNISTSAAIARSKLAQDNIQISSSSGAFVGSGSATTTICSQSITTAGGSVRISIANDASGNPSLFGINILSSDIARLLLVGPNGSYIPFSFTAPSNNVFYFTPPGQLLVDTTINGTPGTYTYTLQYFGNAGGVLDFYFQYMVLVLEELI
jgi:hypothetical protein